MKKTGNVRKSLVNGVQAKVIEKAINEVGIQIMEQELKVQEAKLAEKRLQYYLDELELKRSKLCVELNKSRKRD